jgi:SDR family mycofactocin-dependent oxidoreductase
MGDLTGKVAFITGAARGQGRAHAVRLAADGASVIISDICADIAAIPYPMASREDLEETARLAEKSGGKVSVQVADVRDLAALRAAYDGGLAEVGTDAADIVIANAGGMSYPADEVDEADAFRESIEVLLIGVWNTLKVSMASMIAAERGGSIVLTSSTSAMRGFVGGEGGLDGYTAAKSGVLGLMRAYANLLAPHNIRVNTIHPTGVNSGMVQNEAFGRWAVKAMGETPISSAHNVLPVQLLEPEDVANAVAWLVSDEAKFLTGVALPIDAGFINS